MYVERIRGRNQRIMYPNGSPEGDFDATLTPSVVVSFTDTKVSLLNRRINKHNVMQIVPFMDMTKLELQAYIEELQDVCSKMK